MRLHILFLSCLCFLPHAAAAATLYMDPPSATLFRGDSVTISVRLDTDEAASECVNAIDGVINFSSNINLADVSIGQSIFPVWVEEPKIDQENHRVTFAGGIPNGYCGRVEGDPRLTNTVLQLVLRAPGQAVGINDSKEAQIAFSESTGVYLNDGAGTLVHPALLGATIALSSEAGQDIKDDWKTVIENDIYPPEEFSIALERDEHAFDKKFYIVFTTTDKQSGISRYEVIEEANDEVALFNFGAATAPWKEVRSPYVLTDQTLRSTIRVRAIDKAGNEYLATLAPQRTGGALETVRLVLAGQGSKNETLFLIAIGISLIFILIGISIMVWLYRRRHRVGLITKVIEPESQIVPETEVSNDERELPKNYD